MRISTTEKRVLLLTALFAAVALNVHRLFVLLPGEVRAIGPPWVFNLPELVFQVLYQFSFCIFFGYLNLKWLLWSSNLKPINTLKNCFSNLIFFFVLLLIGSLLQKAIFQNVSINRLYFGGYFFRLLTSLFLIVILVKILLLYRYQRNKEIENQKLRTAYFDAEIKNLRAQINPHFLFNSLSSLSALVRENPKKAQNYIGHLSKVFRYSMTNNPEQLIVLDKEIELLNSNIELLKMRFEDALQISIHVPDSGYKKIPHMTLQPLLENAVKHNLVSLEHPLLIELFQENGSLIFRNTLKKAVYKEVSTGIGLLNLSERYKIVMGKEIEIEKTNLHFIVKLPLN
tara:strand:+ start:1644 stop:2669 length:1026 start_codon:yes stop_codon:yes gene_type:complete